MTGVLQSRGQARGVDAVIFDWGGTLTPWITVDHVQVWRSYASVVRPDDVDATTAALLASEDAFWRAVREEHASGTLDEVITRAGLEPSGELHERGLAAYHQVWEPNTWLDPDVPPLFDGLHERGIKVGVLSNTLWTREHHEAVFRRDGILGAIDGAVYSSEIAWTKPHPEAFLASMAAVGVDQPARCVFVGDRAFEDVHGSQQVGMRAVLVPHSDIPDHQRGHTDGEPDAVAQRLLDLLEIVDAWR